MPRYLPGALIAAVASLGINLISIDNVSLLMALPFIESYFATGEASLQWASSGGYLGAVVTLPAIGALSGRFGSRRLFKAGMALFALSAVVAILSPTVWIFILAKVCGGVASALFVPSAAALLAVNVRRENYELAVSLWVVLGSAGIFIGPLIAAQLLGHLPWQWSLAPQVILASAGWWLARLFRNEPRSAVGVSSFGGVVLVAAVAASATYSLLNVADAQFGILTLVAVTVTVVGAVLFVRATRRGGRLSIFPPELGVNGTYLVTLFASFVYNAAFSGSVYLMMRLLQRGEGAGLAITALLLIAATGGMPIGGYLAKLMVRRISLRQSFLLLATCMIAGCVALAATPPTVLLLFGALFVLVSACMGAIVSVETLSIFAMIPSRHLNGSFSALSLARQLGSIAGIAVIGAAGQWSLGAVGEFVRGWGGNIGFFAAGLMIVPALWLVGRKFHLSAERP